MRIALGISYDGGQFHGWQKQPNCRTVQGELERALSQVADSPIVIHAAGRTDTGVHATGQVIHFDCDNERSARAWVYGTNSYLPHDITVGWAKYVDAEFHARHTATARRYQYYIYNHPIRPSLFVHHLTWHYRPLDVEAMHQAAQQLLGEKDFTSFRSIECQSTSSKRSIYTFDIKRRGDLVILDITANAFLHHMVRNLAGTLMLIGSGKYHIDWIAEVLAAKNRCYAGETAPAYGLYLVHVQYPAELALPNPPALPSYF